MPEPDRLVDGAVDPSQMTDAEWLAAQSKTYPGLGRFLDDPNALAISAATPGLPAPQAPATRSPPKLGFNPVQAMVTGMQGGSSPEDEFVLRIRDLGEKSGAVGQPNSVSPAGAMGRMQVMPGTAKNPGFGIAPARDMSENELARVGSEYAKALLGKYGGNQALASAAYNAGYGNVDKWIKQFGDPRTGEISQEAWNAKIPFSETRNYVARVTGGSLGVPGQSVRLAQSGAGIPMGAEAMTPNPLVMDRRPVGTAAAGVQPQQPPSMSGLVAMALLSKMVPSTHTLMQVQHNPFVEVPRPHDATAEFIPKAQLHPMPRREPIAVQSQMPGARANFEGMLERVLGDTGRPSVRGPVRPSEG